MTDTTSSTATDATSTTDTSSAAADTATSATNAAASTSTNSSATDVDDADRGVLRSSVLAIGRLFGDGLILGLWAVLLALLFLSTGGPRWAFYALLLLGAVLYALLTPPWVRGS